ncbi:STAS domain-containing protein [Pleionea sediminis]|uniref:STAS domain-containing protein n=1 Tax=Pleionea sediminis TaxID=2569479 RepID=UPI001186D624|nr:STAS domain-containing protein [Pleionea sediminis]
MTPKIEYAKIEQFHVFRLNGDIRYGDVVSLQQFVEQLKSENLAFILDLTNTNHLDSTALGTLALMAKYSREAGVEKATIYVTDPIVKETLLGVCFDLVFNIESAEAPLNPSESFAEVEPVDIEAESLAGVVKKAHLTLADICESNKALFKDVNDLLKKS